MDLWTEYEGLTVDGSFPLKKLLQPEGRSAFFATSNAQGEAILIRLIECHFDEEEILARWRGVQALGHPNFLKIDRFGQLLIDDTTVVYAAFEKVDTDLATVLDEGSLSPGDATEIALSVLSALETLHAHGFMHEHVEARNVFAVGETVKLRSDCIRETPEGEAGAEARRRDVQDFAALLKHVLLGTRRFRRVHVHTPLPSPFEEIVHNGTSGLWGLTEIRAALAPPKVQAPATLGPEKANAGIKEPREPGERLKEAEKPAKPAGVAERPFSFKKPAMVERVDATRETSQRGPRARFLDGTAWLQSGLEWPEWLRDPQSMARRWLVAGALAVLVVLIGLIGMRWIFKGHAPAAHKATATSSTASKHTGTSPATPARPDAGSSRLAEPPVASGQAASSQAGSVRGGGPGRTEWRVVAFTYNQEGQARKKASSLGQSHPELRPEVFSPTGRAPWLVTVGGAMQREQAFGLARKARSLGLPRDTYAQNYTPR